jgi:hypothetical protein
MRLSRQQTALSRELAGNGQRGVGVMEPRPEPRRAPVNETAAILPVTNSTRADQDANTNKAIRVVASTPSAEHIIPADIVASLYRHVDQMRAELFAGQLPEVV